MVGRWQKARPTREQQEYTEVQMALSQLEAHMESLWQYIRDAREAIPERLVPVGLQDDERQVLLLAYTQWARSAQVLTSRFQLLERAAASLDGADDG